MKNVFIAVGGSGAKVAEAIVRLLAVGFPTHKDDKGVWTSAGRELQIWHVDPDGSSGARASLQECLNEYDKLQGHLNNNYGRASSGWAMEIKKEIVQLNPLELPRADVSDNPTPTLSGILDSNYGSVNSAEPILSAFYEKKDLEVEVHKGFYQKPFIGAAVMATYAESLQTPGTPGGDAARIDVFNRNKTNFFLCGSLHGGTGACGVPVMSRYLNEQKERNNNTDWRIGGCLLTPYCVPPPPPFKPLPEGTPITQVEVQKHLDAFADHAAFKGLNSIQREGLTRQILGGFFADPDAMEQRAWQGLSYYDDYAGEYFDELYLVGKPNPDTLALWSNGGSNQRNPLNSAEIIAALAALNFYAEANTGKSDQYIIATNDRQLNPDGMTLRDLPSYQINNQDIDAEKVLLATAAASHLLLNAMPWTKDAKAWSKDCPGLSNYYGNDEGKKKDDLNRYALAAQAIGNFSLSMIDKARSVGWNGTDATQLYKYFSNDPKDNNDIANNTAKKFMSSEAKGTLELGTSGLKLTSFDFTKLCPPTADFTRGEYMRFVWSTLFDQAQDKTHFAKA